MDENIFILIGIGVISVVVYSIFYFINKKTKNSSQDKYNYDSYDTSMLTDDQLRKLALGAVLTTQNECEHYELKTSTTPEEWREVLSSYWGITDNSTSIETLEYLLHKGYHYYFEEVYNGLSMSDKNYDQHIRSKYNNPEDISKFIFLRQHLLESIDILKSKQIIQSENDLLQLRATAWDVGRLVSVARMALESGYINEDMFWKYATEAQKVAQTRLNNWEEYGKSYIIGRILWRGKQGGMEITDIVSSLNTNEASPWKILKFK